VPPLGDGQRVRTDRIRLNQVRTLVAVDEGLARLLAALRETGQDQRTAIIVLSDNGFTWGEHRLDPHKGCAYRECLRVPLLIAYPPLTRTGVTDGRIALNIDVAPTVLDLAGLAAPAWMDGRSLLPLLAGANPPWRDDFVIEASAIGEPIPDFQGVASTTWRYTEYADGSRELYDLARDPDELRNLAGDPSQEARRAQQAARLRALLGAPVAPAPPAGLTAMFVSGTGVRLSWADRAKTETGYVVERAVGSGAFAPLGRTLPALSKRSTDAAVAPGAVYRYRVAAVNAVGLSPYSNVVQVTVPR
jgi:hypothetical protein